MTRTGPAVSTRGTGAHREVAQRRGGHAATGLAFQDVGLPQEPRQIHVARLAVQSRRGVDLRDDAMAQDRHLVRHGQCLVLIVRHQNGGRAGPTEDSEDVGAHGRAHGGVQRREGFVQEHDFRADGQRAGECDPLLLATGELMGIPAPIARQPHELEQLVHPASALGAPGKAECDVAAHVEVREQCAFLGDVADTASLARHESPRGIVDDVVTDPHRSVIRPLKARHDAQQRRLAATRRAQNGREGAGRHGEVDATQHRLGPERLGDAREGQPLHADTTVLGASSEPWTLAVICAGCRSNQRPRTYPGTAAITIITPA